MHEKASQHSLKSHEGPKLGAKTALRLGDDLLTVKQSPFSSLLHRPSAFSSALSTNVRNNLPLSMMRSISRFYGRETIQTAVLTLNI